MSDQPVIGCCIDRLSRHDFTGMGAEHRWSSNSENKLSGPPYLLGARSRGKFVVSTEEGT